MNFPCDAWIKGVNIVTAVAWVRSLAQELPYATGIPKEKNKKRKQASRTLKEGFHPE